MTYKNVLWYRLNKTTPDFSISSGSLWANPDFVDWANKDFHLKSTSAAINKGLANSLLPDYDLDWNDRIYNSVVDLGAYEYQPIIDGIINLPPAITMPDSMSTSENQLISFTVLASDPNNDTLTYSVTGLPQGATFNNQTGAFSWTPTYDQAGSHSLMFSAFDGSLRTDKLMTILVSNVNRLPAFQSLGDKTVAEKELLIFSVKANDPDGDALIYSAVGLPQGAVFDTSTHVFSWTPTDTQAGSYSVTFRASDGQSITERIVAITVADASAPPADGLIVEQTVNTQDYDWTSGTVYKYGSDILTMYGNRTVAYDLVMAESAVYSLTIDTAQVTRKEAPPNYQFNFNVYVDDVLIGNYNFSAVRNFMTSELINLGTLSQGAHRVKLQWTNDKKDAGTDANVGLKNLALLREAPDPVVVDGAPEPSPSEPTLYEALNMQDYTSASGAVYLYESDALVMYGERSVSYSLDITQSDNYFMTLDTKQATRASIPYDGYEFNINIYVDGLLLGNYDLSAMTDFMTSDLISLGSLSLGFHTLTVQWTNDDNLSSTLDSNLGMSNLLLYR